MKELISRNEIEEQYKWAIEDIYASEEDWESEFKKVQEMIQAMLPYEGKITSDSKTLLDFLNMFEEVSYLYERVSIYACQKYDEDTTIPKYQDLKNRADGLGVYVDSQISFFIPELLEKDETIIRGYIKEEDGLRKYERFLEEIYRQKDHILSKDMEELIAMAGEVLLAPKNTFMMFNNADIKFPVIKDGKGEDIEITLARYGGLIESSNREVRKSAFESLNGTYNKFRNMLAANYSACIKAHSFEAKARHYESTIAMSLEDNEIPMSVYHNLLDSIHDSLPVMYRYVDLRKKMLNVDELHMYDLYAPIVSDVHMKITFEEAKQTVVKALEPLGEEYLAIVKSAFENRWIDVCPNKGKRTGAYSWGPYGTHPYVLLNHQDDLNHMFTLAHEMGHAMHSFYSDNALPYLDAKYVTFVAEVASTCNEALLMEYLLKTITDKKEKAYVLNHFLEQFRATIFRQTMFAEFEMKSHKMVEDEESLTADALCNMYHDLNVLYFGSNIVVDHEIDIEWAKIPHFYRPFYVYQYATGYIAAIALSRRILSEGEEAVKDYKKFLSGGCSMTPIDLLKVAGVDMSTKEPAKLAIQLFDSLLDQMEELLK